MGIIKPTLENRMHVLGRIVTRIGDRLNNYGTVPKITRHQHRVMASLEPATTEAEMQAGLQDLRNAGLI